MKTLISIISFIIASIAGIDVFLYLFLAPETTISVLLFLLVIYLFFEFIFLKQFQWSDVFKRRSFAFQTIFILFYVFSVFIVGNLTCSREISRWYRAKTKLEMIKKAIKLKHKKDHHFPNTLSNVNGHRKVHHFRSLKNAPL